MLLERDEHGRFLNTGGPTVYPRRAKRKSGQPAKRRPLTVKHYKVDALLTDPAEREAYQKVLADPTATIASLQAWLRARGKYACRSAVMLHRRAFNADLRQLREAAHMAETFVALSRTLGGSGAITEASHTHFEMLLMRSLHAMRDHPGLGPADLKTLSKMVSDSVDTRRQIEQMKSEAAAQARLAAQRAADDEFHRRHS